MTLQPGSRLGADEIVGLRIIPDALASHPEGRAEPVDQRSDIFSRLSRRFVVTGADGLAGK